MAVSSQSTVTWPRVVGLVFGLGTQIFFLATVPSLFFFLRDGATTAGNWIAVDGLLALQFAVLHSILLLPSMRARISRMVSSQLYGSLFAAATCATLWLIFLYWRSSHLVIWDISGRTKLGVQACFYLSWVSLFLSLRISGFGYQTGWTQWLYWLRREPLPRRPLSEHGPYRWMRHPAYLSFLGLIWFTPRMTADHAALTAIWTAYIYVGSCLKDRRLLFYLGNVYREYASRVPGYPGILFGPLAKWPAEQVEPRAEAVQPAGARRAA